MKNQSNTTTFLKGAAWLTLSTIILKVIGLIYKVPLSYMLGDEGMGYFNSAYTVYVLFYVVGTSGIPRAISILVAKREAESQCEADAIFRSAFKFFFAAGVILLIIFFCGADMFSIYIGNPRSALAMYSIAPSILFVCAGGVIRGYLSGRMRFAPIAVSELISGLLKLVLGLLLANMAIRSGKSLPQIAAYTLLGITVGSLVSLIYLALVYLRVPKARPRATLPLKKTINDILRIAIPITLASVVGSIVSILDLILIMNGLEDSGYSTTLANILYGSYTTLAVPMLSLVSTLISPITTAMLPILAASSAKSDKAEYSTHLTTSLSLTCLITTPPAVFFAAFSREILSVIFEEGSAALSAPFLAFLAPGILLIGPLTAINTALEGSGRPSAAFLSLFLGAVAKLIVGISLLKWTNLGILCAPIGTSVSYLISFLVSRLYIKSTTEASVPVSRSLFAPLTASVISAFATAMFMKFIDLPASIRMSGLVCTAFFATLYIVTLLILSPRIRNTVLQYGKMNKKQTKQL